MADGGGGNPETVLITGASSGIGRSLSRLFARDGYTVVLVARRAAALEELASELSGAYGVVARVIPADLAQPGGAQTLHGDLQRAGITVDVVVNNAGFGLQGDFARLPLERQLEMIVLNVTALTVLTRLLLTPMIERRRGGVLNVGSTAAFQPGPFMAVYFATKAYVVSFSDALAEELEGSGLKVSCLAPGPTVTGFAAEAGATQSRLFQGDTMTSDDVARIGYEGWKQGKPLVIAGLRNRINAFMVRLAPRGYVKKAVRRLNAR